jgi:hypothetical protein
MTLQLFARLPSFRSPRTSLPVIPDSARRAFPALVDDFAVLDEVVGQAFRKSDIAALRHQNRYRRQQLLVLVGSVVTSGLGGLQALVEDQRWPGILLALFGVALAVSSRATSELGAQNEYLAERVKAERLRALHFRFLSRTGKFAREDRDSVLRLAVIDIEAGREPR